MNKNLQTHINYLALIAKLRFSWRQFWGCWLSWYLISKQGTIQYKIFTMTSLNKNLFNDDNSIYLNNEEDDAVDEKNEAIKLVTNLET